MLAYDEGMKLGSTDVDIIGFIVWVDDGNTPGTYDGFDMGYTYGSFDGSN